MKGLFIHLGYLHTAFSAPGAAQPLQTRVGTRHLTNIGSASHMEGANGSKLARHAWTKPQGTLLGWKHYHRTFQLVRSSTTPRGRRHSFGMPFYREHAHPDSGMKHIVACAMPLLDRLLSLLVWRWSRRHYSEFCTSCRSTGSIPHARAEFRL